MKTPLQISHKLKHWNIKLHNRRVSVGYCKQHDGYYIRFRRLMPDKAIKRTEFTLSAEAADALLSCLNNAMWDREVQQ